MILRCGKKISKMADCYKLEAMLKPLEGSIKLISDTLVNIKSLFDNKTIKIQARLDLLEAKCALNEHVTKMLERKINDNEQYSRKINLRLVGIDIEPDESATTLMEKIKTHDVIKSSCI